MTEESELVDLHDRLQEIGTHIRAFEFRAALKVLMEISSTGNQLLQFNEPWKLVKTDEDTEKVVMNTALQVVTALSVACRPFLPFTSDKIRDLLNLPRLKDEGEYMDLLNKLAEGEVILADGHQINKPNHLFTKIPDEVIDAQIAKLAAAEKANKGVSYEPVKDTIAFDDFTKLDMRTGTILAAEKVKKTKKLLKLTVDLGFEERTVVSGIAEFFKPEDTIGKQVLLLANLAPRKLKGIESQGMILMAENSDGVLDFVSPGDGMGNGFVVK